MKLNITYNSMDELVKEIRERDHFKIVGKQSDFSVQGLLLYYIEDGELYCLTYKKGKKNQITVTDLFPITYNSQKNDF